MRPRSAKRRPRPRRKRERVAPQLLFQSLNMIEIDVCIPQRVHERTGRQVAFLRNHREQQCIARDIERNSQAEIGGPLIELAIESARPADVKLKQDVTRWQPHLSKLSRIPRADDDAS